MHLYTAHFMYILVLQRRRRCPCFTMVTRTCGGKVTVAVLNPYGVYSKYQGAEQFNVQRDKEIPRSRDTDRNRRHVLTRTSRKNEKFAV